MAKKTSTIVLLGLLTLLCLIGNIMSQEAKENEISFKSLNTKEFKLMANLIPPQKIIFRDEKQWNDFWNKYGSSNKPKIDFGRFIVLGIFLGEKPCPGYGVEITKVRKIKSKIIVEFIEYLPNPELGYPAVIVYPYDIIFFLRTEGNVIFSSRKKVRD